MMCSECDVVVIDHFDYIATLNTRVHLFYFLATMLVRRYHIDIIFWLTGAFFISSLVTETSEALYFG